MHPQVAELLIRWSVRLAIACYLGRVALDLGLLHRSEPASVRKVARRLWTVGCFCYLVHVVCAFEFVHDWSHELAAASTAEQTERLVGIRSGAGLYANYAFTGLWLADTTAWWLRGATRHPRSRAYFWAMHSLFAFMVFNATVIFGPPLWRPVAAIVALGMIVIYFQRTATVRASR